MKKYIQPQTVIERLANAYAVCQRISSPGGVIGGFGTGDGGGGR